MGVLQFECHISKYKIQKRSDRQDPNGLNCPIHSGERCDTMSIKMILTDLDRTLLRSDASISENDEDGVADWIETNILKPRQSESE